MALFLTMAACCLDRPPSSLSTWSVALGIEHSAAVHDGDAAAVLHVSVENAVCFLSSLCTKEKSSEVSHTVMMEHLVKLLVLVDSEMVLCWCLNVLGGKVRLMSIMP